MAKEANFKKEKLRVLSALTDSQRLSRSQITIGPLRHIKQKIRQQVLRDLVSLGAVEQVKIKGDMGPRATHFKITLAGQSYRLELSQ